MLKEIILLANTVRYLKWQQIYFRVIRKLFKPQVTERFQEDNLRFSGEWQHLELYNKKINPNLEACFLNYKKTLDLPFDWNNEKPSKLWTYNLHYFEDLLADNASQNAQFHHDLFNLWIDQNPVGTGNGWEAYPTSLRIVNILKAGLGGFKLNKKMLRSVYSQASYLSNNLEKHLLGNHYFVNLKALLFAGLMFGQPRWCGISVRGLLLEIPEQILQDGANFELSPMYHSLMLVDVLDLLNLIRAYPAQHLARLGMLLEERIPKMLMYQDAMAHPDRGLSFFNDSANGIAPTIAKIESYAVKLGFKIDAPNSSKPEIIDNVDSGYFSATTGNNKLIFDAANVGPDYIPGHAHADTLSFELSVGEQRVFVNSGTSEYGLGIKRLNQRKSASHNTVEVDGKDSSQVWSGFRVANRARILDRFATLKSSNKIILQASHNGYKTLFSGCIHTRKLMFSSTALVVSDSLKGSFNSAKSRFHFHPDLTISLEGGLLRVEGPKFVLRSDLTSQVCSIANSYWYPEFGTEIPNKVLEIDFTSERLEVMFIWVCK
tara:strand:- start:1590 stop:3227 length:1638 start_codon:yes stop_codon:yes gene_type:complete